MYPHIHLHIPIYIYIYIDVNMYLCLHVCMHACIYIYIYIYGLYVYPDSSGIPNFLCQLSLPIGPRNPQALGPERALGFRDTGKPNKVCFFFKLLFNGSQQGVSGFGQTLKKTQTAGLDTRQDELANGVVADLFHLETLSGVAGVESVE